MTRGRGVWAKTVVKRPSPSEPCLENSRLVWCHNFEILRGPFRLHVMAFFNIKAISRNPDTYLATFQSFARYVFRVYAACLLWTVVFGRASA